MKKNVWLVLGGIIILGIMFLISPRNQMVSLDENVKAKWGEVENQYQRRLDLVDNLVQIVKGAASHEKETLTEVIQARAQATKMNVNIQDVEEMAAFQKSQSGLSSAMSRLLVTVENYPDLKVNQNFLELQVQIEGTENRIAVARKDFNEAVQRYNTYIRKFPNNLVASWFGFEQANTFKAEIGANKAPKIQF